MNTGVKMTLFISWSWLNQFLFLVLTSPALEKTNHMVLKTQGCTSRPVKAWIYGPLDDTHKSGGRYFSCFASNKHYTLEWKKRIVSILVVTHFIIYRLMMCNPLLREMSSKCSHMGETLRLSAGFVKSSSSVTGETPTWPLKCIFCGTLLHFIHVHKSRQHLSQFHK